MSEDRYVKITYQEARKLYEQGGFQRDIVLKSFTETELTREDLPATWEEFCKRYPLKKGECFIGIYSQVMPALVGAERPAQTGCNILPSEKEVAKHLALMKLHQLRDCYRKGWEPDFSSHKELKFAIVNCFYDYTVNPVRELPRFLAFPTEELAKLFLENFRGLIREAGDLI